MIMLLSFDNPWFREIKDKSGVECLAADVAINSTWFQVKTNGFCFWFLIYPLHRLSFYEIKLKMYYILDLFKGPSNGGQGK